MNKNLTNLFDVKTIITGLTNDVQDCKSWSWLRRIRTVLHRMQLLHPLFRKRMAALEWTKLPHYNKFIISNQTVRYHMLEYIAGNNDWMATMHFHK